MTAQPVPLRRAPTPNLVAPHTLDLLTEIERKVLWLACWTIHNANHLRESRDGLKVGGHQSSSASVATLMTALYMQALRPEDRVAVKPHASPIFHAIQYLLGNQSRDQLERFRALGGAQSYPSRTKDKDDVDFSTGSVGLGVGVTLFASLVQDYVRLHRLGDTAPAGRMVAVLGDAELDEGNVYEALLEGWKHDVRNLWWIIDYNRQSLDGVVHDYLFQRIGEFFQSVGWRVVNIKYGKLLEAAFEGPAGGALRRWIDDCPNDLYAALTFKGGAAWREHLKRDLQGTSGFKELLDSHDDTALQRLMTNLGGHDMASVLEALLGVEDDTPHCFVAYTIKGYGLPLAGHKDNHAGLMTVEQMARFKAAHQVPDGAEWEPFAGLDADPEELRRFLAEVPFKKRAASEERGERITVDALPTPQGATLSTQEAFGKVLNDIGRRDDELARRIVTTSPDVTVSTNLGGWVNQRGVFERSLHPDVFRAEKVASPLKWEKSPTGQHIELGIAENNLFLMLAALGLSDRLFGGKLLPVGTLYDPFIARGLDALNYACYQDARFMVVATPSGITLAPEGGAHQSITTPLIGLSQPGLTAFEPAFADELATIMEWGFEHMQAPDGGSVYLRLSTRPIRQPERAQTPALKAAIIDGAYWLKAPVPGADLAIVYTGAVAPEALDAHAQVSEEVPDVGLLAVTSAGRLHAGWQEARRARAAGNSDALAPVEALLGTLAPDAGLVTVTDGHPGALSWLGAVAQHAVAPLGVESFGQSGDIADLYRLHGLDAEAILDAVAELYIRRARRRRRPAAA